MKSTNQTKGLRLGQGMAWLAGAVSCVSMSVMAAGQARATVYLSNNFNNNGSGLGSWTAPNGGVTDTGTESAFTNTTNGNSALLDSGTSNSGTSTVLDSSAFSVPIGDPTQISFDFDITAANVSNNDNFVLNNSRNIILNFGSFASASAPTQPSAMVYKNGANGVTTTFTPSLNTWYHVTLGLSAENAVTPSWSLNVTNTAGQSLYSASDISFTNTLEPYSSLSYSFNVGSQASGAEFQIDNVLVATPEPTAISLLVLGGVGLLILKPRKRVQA